MKTITALYHMNSILNRTRYTNLGGKPYRGGHV